MRSFVGFATFATPITSSRCRPPEPYAPRCVPLCEFRWLDAISEPAHLLGKVALDDASRWVFVGGLILFLTSESVMARLFTHHTAWERLIAIGLLGIAGLALGDLTAAALGVVVSLVLVTTLGAETARHREALSQLR